jgi:hypothetical protein
VARLQTADRSCAADSQEAHLVKADLRKSGALPSTVLASTAPKPVAAAAPPIPRSRPQIQPQKQAQAAPAGDPLGLRGSLK